MEKITLCANDEPAFKKIVDVLNTCFSKDYRGYQRSILNLNSDEMVWFPQISALEQNGYRSTGSHGWINYTEDDWEHICEENYTIKNAYIHHDNHRERYVFAKDRNGVYIFRGKYKYDESKSTFQKWVYRRIATSVELAY